MRLGRLGAALALVAAHVLSARAGAQIIRPGGALSSEPRFWVSAGAGLAQLQTIEDYATSSAWNFGTVTQWRATIERSLRNGGSAGVAGTWASPTLAYEDGGCLPSCDAEAELFQLLALFRMGGGQGFHQVIELHAGVTGFRNFTTGGAQRLAPLGTVLDPTFAVGYGFGYGFSRRTHVMIVQDVGAILHRRDNAPAGANTLRQFQTTRVGFRVGR